ncbi:MAG: hypothetical protein KDD76_05475, partial [Rickettsiales bacterium]|nr:hypothetical protein [Rickettsiales bacterium]
WEMQSDGTYNRPSFNEFSFAAHDYFIANPSLSGRGSALRGAAFTSRQELQESYQAPVFTRTAVIDVGSNSVRLVVYDGIKRSPLPIYNEKVLCGLATHINQTGKLYADGVVQAEKALDRFTRIIRAMGVSDICAFATSAVRDAKDGRTFIRRMEKRHNITIRVLSGEEEARFAALGVASSCYEADGVVGDLGGGSLELAGLSFTQPGETHFSSEEAVTNPVSFPIGPLRLLNGGRQHAKRSSIISEIDRYLESYPMDLCKQSFYAVGGGFRALAKLHSMTTDYPLSVLEEYSVKPAELEKTLDRVINATLTELRIMPTISEKRINTLPLTALILKRIIHHGKPEYITFSTHGVREGVLFDRLSGDLQSDDVLLASCTDMIAHISPDISSDTGNQWVVFGKELCEWISPLFPDETHHMRRLRQASCLLSRLAWYEHTAYRAEMAFRWVLDSEIQGIDHWERVFIATVLFHRYQTTPNTAIMASAQSLLDHKWIQRAKAIGMAMRLGYECSGAAPLLFKHVRLQLNDKYIVLKVQKSHASLVSDNVKSRLQKLAKVMRRNVTIETASW